MPPRFRAFATAKTQPAGADTSQRYRTVQHHAALSFERVPAFYKQLMDNTAVSASCLQFLI